MPSVAVACTVKENPSAVAEAVREGREAVGAAEALPVRLPPSLLTLAREEALGRGEGVSEARALAVSLAEGEGEPVPVLAVGEAEVVGERLARAVGCVREGVAEVSGEAEAVRETEKEALAHVCEALGVVE